MLGDLLADLLGSLLGDVPGLATARKRLKKYARGERISFRAQIRGSAGSAGLADHLVAERGQVWASVGKGENATLYPLPRPASNTQIESHLGRLKSGKSWHMSYQSKD